ncbi:MAG: histidine triad nucleotide-binding protein [Sumerlaeia bacterium]
MAETVFGKILAGEIPAERVYEDAFCIVIRDIAPQAPTHLLVIPKEPIATVADLGDEHKELVGHMTVVASRVAEKEGLADDGYRLVWNCKDAGGQEVPHIHLHVLGGRQMKWPPG